MLARDRQTFRGTPIVHGLFRLRPRKLLPDCVTYARAYEPYTACQRAGLHPSQAEGYTIQKCPYELYRINFYVVQAQNKKHEGKELLV